MKKSIIVFALFVAASVAILAQENGILAGWGSSRAQVQEFLGVKPEVSKGDADIYSLDVFSEGDAVYYYFKNNCLYKIWILTPGYMFRSITAAYWQAFGDCDESYPSFNLYVWKQKHETIEVTFDGRMVGVIYTDSRMSE